MCFTDQHEVAILCKWVEVMFCKFSVCMSVLIFVSFHENEPCDLVAHRVTEKIGREISSVAYASWTPDLIDLSICLPWYMTCALTTRWATFVQIDFLLLKPLTGLLASMSPNAKIRTTDKGIAPSSASMKCQVAKYDLLRSFLVRSISISCICKRSGRNFFTSRELSYDLNRSSIIKGILWHPWYATIIVTTW